MFREAVRWFKDSLFPYYCGCGQEGEWWCEVCRAGVKPFTKRTEGPIQEVTVLFYFEENGESGRLVKRFKYDFVTDLSELWTKMMVESNFDFGGDWVVVPVPLFVKRKKERGFNQAELIARALAETYGCRFLDGLERIRETDQQAKLNKADRIKNVSEAFRWRNNEAVPEQIILVDDVYTSGATMNECARVLLSAGAREVKGFVLGHGGSPS